MKSQRVLHNLHRSDGGKSQVMARDEGKQRCPVGAGYDGVSRPVCKTGPNLAETASLYRLTILITCLLSIAVILLSCRVSLCNVLCSDPRRSFSCKMDNE